MRTMHRLLCATIVAAALNLALASAANADLASGVELFDAGQIEQAHPIFAAAVQNDPTNAEALFYLGQVELMTGEFDAAIQHLKLAVDIDDQKSVYYQKLGEAYGSKAGEANFIRQVGLAGNIKDAFERAVELDPENIDARLGLVTYYVNAVSITGGGNKKARKQATEIRNRDTLLGHYAFAQVYASEGESFRVEQEYRAAMEAVPDDNDPVLALGVYLTDAELYREAMIVYDEWLAMQPDDMRVTYQVGRTASVSGEYLEQGEFALETYLQYQPAPDEPGLDWAHYRLGLVYQHQGRTAGARLEYEAALGLNPEHDEARKALKKL